VKGAIEALEEIEGLQVILVGKEGIIKEELKKYKYDTSRIEIKNADEVIEMTDDPVKAVREKKDSSMNVCIDLVKEKLAQASVALLNIGEEETKGNELTRETYALLKENKDIDFYGNIESTKIMDGEVDVVVTDGYTGNVLLKTSEGVGKFIFHIVKESIMESWIAKLGALLIKGAMKKVKKKTEASEYGGAIFLGLSELSLKAHGNSDSRAIKNALKVASKFIELNFIEELRKTMEVE